MQVAVLNGSPKGKYSVTLQSVLYLEKQFQDDSFEIINVGQQIKKLEKPDQFETIMQKLSNYDLILFSYPVYTFIAPYQLHRFIELMKQSSLLTNLKGKFATQLTTSKHFFDITAHHYIEDNCNDMELKYIKGISCDMDDLLTEKGRKELKLFWKYVRFSVKSNVINIANHTPSKFDFVYDRSLDKNDVKPDFETVIVTNCTDEDVSLKNMIDDFCATYKYKTKIININDFKFSGGCLGCFNCASDGKCIYKDGFEDLLRNTIQKADSIIYAATIKDHSMGASFKLYNDRQFCNGHRTVTMGMPVGYILSGEYSKESNLKTIVEGRSEVGHNYLTSVVCDESKDNDVIKNNLMNLSLQTEFALENKLVLPENFYGVGGMKIFRDLIYVMRGLMKEDHKFYKKHGIYDFPQKKRKTMIKMILIGWLMSIPSVKAKSKGKMNEAIIKPYKEAINK
ncbi:NAD(P)H-dependent oxidoreductase [Vallitalea guaymasensis]|uniref:NAD(P)H-dependent oxidoreductase n=1 Tax=Vallitalea guaymasensis TaxID=1185412 RepID=A0A8J8M7K0_9FIRM|nr:NAD(P)H-dependent oxidoreductase [Vallitalea guaymasensis]QUH27844.1 NAD(P)H-dependent oxidoreductase [Vallitalea guaymasensis]